MAITFRYKNPVSWSYAPGIVLNGEKGDDGLQGKYGNALYFTDFELNNAYNIELALQKIENNYVLSTANLVQLNARPYKAGDLILSNTGVMYQLIENKSSINFKYDIKLLGELRGNSNASVGKIRITDITNALPAYAIQECPVVAPSCHEYVRYDEDGNLVSDQFAVHDGRYKLRGKWYMLTLFGSKQSIDIESTLKSIDVTDPAQVEAIKKYLSGEDSISARYSVTLRFKMTKEYCTDIAPDDTSTRKGTAITFYKELEFPNMDLNDEKETDATKIKYKIVYLSDALLDRIHPAGNNIFCTLNNNGDLWYKTGVKAKGPDDTGNMELGDGAYVTTEEIDPETGEVIKVLKCTATVNEIKKSMNYTELTDERSEEPDGEPVYIAHEDVMNFPQYSAGNNLVGTALKMSGNMTPSDLIENELATNLEDTHLIERDCRPSGNINMTAGNSTYFSGIEDDEECLNEIAQFISSGETEAFVTIRNNATKEITSAQIAVEYTIA